MIPSAPTRDPQPKPLVPRSDPLEQALRLRDADVVSMVRAAVQHQEVTLAYQPVFRPSAPSQPVFHESLLRVMDATGRIIPAKEFLPTIHQSPLARDLDTLALKLAFLQLVRHPELCLSVNMSARAIGYRPWQTLLQNVLKKHPSIARRITLEISEKSVLELPDQVADFMAAYQPKGLAFALDHYGAESTSFQLLRDLCFDMVKLDGSLTAGLAQDSATHAIAESVTQLIRNLDMHCVATQVENPADATALGHLKIPYVQGFAFQAPTLRPPWAAQSRVKQAG